MFETLQGSLYQSLGAPAMSAILAWEPPPSSSAEEWEGHSPHSQSLTDHYKYGGGVGVTTKTSTAVHWGGGSQLTNIQ